MIETNRVEYKAKLTDGLEKEIVAFLNYKDGGIVYIGIDNVINAIVHNDWISEVPPLFEIYDDRLEITSAGGTSIIKNIEHFFQGYSNPNNREIMRIFKDLDMVEHLGSGMNRILTYYKKENFLLEDIFLRVTFFSNRDEIKDVGTNELFKFIKAHQPIRVAQIKEHFNKVTIRTIERWIKQLKDEDKIEFIGSKKTGGYFAK